MKDRNSFLDTFLRGGGPRREMLLAFALGLLVVGVLSNLIFTLVLSPAETWPRAWAPFAVASCLTILAYLLYQRGLKQKTRVVVDVDESRLAPSRQGLVWMLGPGRFDHLVFALRHHAQGGGAAHCWLVMQDTVSVQQAFSQLSQELPGRGLSTRLHPIYITQLDVQTAYQAVRNVFDREAPEEGLEASQIIADITGGTKPLTAGMVLAALAAGRELEYVESERDTEGNPIADTLRVVLVDASFSLVRAK